MKRILLVLIVASLLAAPALAREPFVVDGEINMQIVADTPRDIIIGSEVAAYLQQFQDRAMTGLATTPDEIDVDERGFILIGTRSDNRAVDEVLGEREVTGPTLAFIGDDYVITGRTQSEVATAADAFISGTTQLNAPEQEVEQPELIEDPPEALEQPDESNESAQAPPSGSSVAERTAEPPEPTTCEPTTFCDGDVVKQRSADCSERNVRYCGSGCFQGACQQGFFARVWDFISFWN